MANRTTKQLKNEQDENLSTQSNKGEEQINKINNNSLEDEFISNNNIVCDQLKNVRHKVKLFEGSSKEFLEVQINGFLNSPDVYPLFQGSRLVSSVVNGKIYWAYMLAYLESYVDE